MAARVNTRTFEAAYRDAIVELRHPRFYFLKKILFSGARAMRLQHTIKAVIRPGEEFGFVAECLVFPIVIQGKSLDAVTRNLQEAVTLHLEEEILQELGLIPNPTILITFEIEPLRATA